MCSCHIKNHSWILFWKSEKIKLNCRCFSLALATYFLPLPSYTLHFNHCNSCPQAMWTSSFSSSFYYKSAVFYVLCNEILVDARKSLGGFSDSRESFKSHSISTLTLNRIFFYFHSFPHHTWKCSIRWTLISDEWKCEIVTLTFFLRFHFENVPDCLPPDVSHPATHNDVPHWL